MNLPKFDHYPFEIRPLTEDDGGGFLITFPDLPGCMADGETPEEAIREGRDAFNCWMAAHYEAGREIPVPNSHREAIRFAESLPVSLRGRLSTRAKQKGVSLTDLVVMYISEGLGKSDSMAHK